MDVLFSEDNCSSGFSPIIRSFNKRFLETVPQYLNEVEKRVWNELRALVSPESSVLYEEDAAILLRLYLSAYGRYFKDKNFPAVVFLDGVGSYRDSVLEIIAEVLEELSPEFDIIPVLFLISLISPHVSGILILSSTGSNPDPMKIKKRMNFQ